LELLRMKEAAGASRRDPCFKLREVKQPAEFVHICN
jgi:hypothetical protein